MKERECEKGEKKVASVFEERLKFRNLKILLILYLWLKEEKLKEVWSHS